MNKSINTAIGLLFVVVAVIACGWVRYVQQSLDNIDRYTREARAIDNWHHIRLERLEPHDGEMEMGDDK